MREGIRLSNGFRLPAFEYAPAAADILTEDCGLRWWCLSSEERRGKLLRDERKFLEERDDWRASRK